MVWRNNQVNVDKYNYRLKYLNLQMINNKQPGFAYFALSIIIALVTGASAQYYTR